MEFHEHGCIGQVCNSARSDSKQRRILLAAFVINLTAFAVMLAGSIASGSSALLSGTLDNFGDALTFALSFAVVSASPAAKARVSLFKGIMILVTALAVAIQIGFALVNARTPVVDTMSTAALINLVANLACLRLLSAYRRGDINMSSAWECTRNDVIEGIAIVLTAIAVWLTGSHWPDLLAAIVLLFLFLRSALGILGASWQELHRIRDHALSGEMELRANCEPRRLRRAG